MADPAFTPAPWHAEAAAARYAVFAGTTLVAGRIARQQDAQLIEAAPDLYGAAVAACDWLALISPTSPVTRRLQAALDLAVH